MQYTWFAKRHGLCTRHSRFRCVLPSDSSSAAYKTSHVSILYICRFTGPTRMHARVLRQQKSSLVESLNSTKTSSSSSSSAVNGGRTRRVRFNDGHLTTTTSSCCCNVSASSSCSSCSSHSSAVDSIAPQSHVCQYRSNVLSL